MYVGQESRIILIALTVPNWQLRVRLIGTSGYYNLNVIKFQSAEIAQLQVVVPTGTGTGHWQAALSPGPDSESEGGAHSLALAGGPGRPGRRRSATQRSTCIASQSLGAVTVCISLAASRLLVVSSTCTSSNYFLLRV